MDRRNFLKTTAVATSATLLGGRQKDAGAVKDAATSIKKYNTLGKTGLKVADISFGTGKLPSPSLAERAFDMGMNYFDTAPDYGYAETLLGKFIKNRKSERSKMIIASKICDPLPYPGHLARDASPQQMIKAVDDSLKRLNTDYLDIVFVHALAENLDDQKRMNGQNIPEALEKLKKAGKVRYTSFSSHGPYRMEKTVEMAVDSGIYDMMMVAFNFGKFPNLMPVIKKAYAKGMGVMAMKSLAGGKHLDLGKFGADDASFAQSALRWVNSHKEISGTVITVTNVDMLKSYVAVSGSKFTAADENILNRYAKTYINKNCRIGCGECLSSCPEGVNVAAVLRYDMYYENYIDHKEIALAKYAALKENGSPCAQCSSARCEGACPFGLPVRDMLVKAHSNLSTA